MKTYWVAMPEQRARVLRATRSPRRILRKGPRTVAQCLMGVKEVPSFMCHSTLEGVLAWLLERSCLVWDVGKEMCGGHTCSRAV